MNTDIEMQKNDNKLKDSEKDAQNLNEIDLEKVTDQEAPSEDSLLKREKIMTDSKDYDSSGPGGEKSGAKEGVKGLREWLSKSRVKWWIAVLVAVVLLTVVLVGTLIAFEDSDYDVPDHTIRLIRLWPKPNKPKNVINFVHGTLPVEGRVWPDLTKQLDHLLSRYQANYSRSKKVIECFGNSPPAVNLDKICKFDIRGLMMECSKAMNYGYDQGKPCVFLVFDNITGWVPELYSTRELANYVDAADRSASSMVYLDCQGDTPLDQENMGRIQYTPARGFPTKYFPYRGQSDYMPPLVGLRFTNPAIGVAISVTCKLWAKNINHTDEANPSGQISFNLLVD